MTRARLATSLVDVFLAGVANALPGAELDVSHTREPRIAAIGGDPELTITVTIRVPSPDAEVR